MPKRSRANADRAVFAPLGGRGATEWKAATAPGIDRSLDTPKGTRPGQHRARLLRSARTCGRPKACVRRTRARVVQTPAHREPAARQPAGLRRPAAPRLAARNLA